MDIIELGAKPRTILGKSVQRLRRQGFTPVNVYGHGIPSAAMQVETRPLLRALAKSGKSTLLTLVVDSQESRTVLVRDIQLDPRSHILLHVDFYQVNLAEKVKLAVPLHFVGELGNAVKAGALVHSLTALEVECFPQSMPHSIEVDLSVLQDFNKPIHVKDLSVPPDVTILSDLEEIVAMVEPPRVVEEEAAPVTAEE
ncbi:MAG: 50S ribosomal protein L25, partial [Dehalococcoidia bacterium]|nr:50S ribosomal protein L25 [Dehalococcoidia bacterium]